MAANQTASFALLTFKDLFTCCSCSTDSSEPYYLSCGDVICKKCLPKATSVSSGCAKSSEHEDTGYIDCPVCGSKDVAHRSSLAILDSEIFKNLNLGCEIEVGGSKNLFNPSESFPHSACGGKTPSSAFCSVCSLDSSKPPVVAVDQCLDCLDLLCKDCSKAHSRTRCTNHHVTASIVEIMNGSKLEERKRRFRLPCKMHPDKPLCLYCLSCNQMVCLQCKLINHNNHICTDLRPAASTQRQMLTADQNAIKKNIREVEELLLLCDKRRGSAERRRCELIEMMTKRVKYFREQLNIYTKQLETQVTNHFAEYTKGTNETEALLKSHLFKLTSLKVLSDRLLTRGTDVELLASKHQYADKIKNEFQENILPSVPELKELKFSVPNTRHLAVGYLYGHLSTGKASDSQQCYTQDEHCLSGMLGEGDKVPSRVSPSVRIYEAEKEGLGKDEASQSVIKSDFKKCIEFYNHRRRSTVKQPIQDLVIGLPTIISSWTCQPRGGSVVKVASMSNGDLVAAVFQRNYDFEQTRHCTRVRLQIHGRLGEVKMDVAYGAVIYGLAIGKEDQIVISGGQYGQNNIDVIWSNGQSTNFATHCDVGGVVVDSEEHIIVAGHKIIEYYTMEGEFLRSYPDDMGTSNRHKNSDKGFECVRKELAITSNEEVFISDPNTNSIRGYSKDGELLFKYGDYGRDVVPIINPRGIIVDKFDNILVCDLLTNSIHVICRRASVLHCKILEGKLSRPRDVTYYDSCYIAIAQNNGLLEVYQYMYDKDDDYTN